MSLHRSVWNIFFNIFFFDIISFFNIIYFKQIQNNFDTYSASISFFHCLEQYIACDGNNTSVRTKGTRMLLSGNPNVNIQDVKAYLLNVTKGSPMEDIYEQKFLYLGFKNAGFWKKGSHGPEVGKRGHSTSPVSNWLTRNMGKEQRWMGDEWEENKLKLLIYWVPDFWNSRKNATVMKRQIGDHLRGYCLEYLNEMFMRC